MRIGFVTCVQLGLSCMEAIYEAGGQLSFAMTLQDEIAPRKAGRVYLDAFCARHQIGLLKVANINDAAAVDAVKAADLEWLFVIGWSQIARSEILSAPRQGVLGMHPTLLPIGRGRAPIPWALLLGLEQTGVTLFKLDAGVDTGPIVAQTRIGIAPRETATSLYARIDAAHTTLLKDNWPALVSGRLSPTPQDDRNATVWRARRPEDGLLTPSMTAVEADRLIRAVTHPYPGAFFETPEGRLRVWTSGAPFDDLGGGAAGPVKRLVFSDGWLDATDWACEPQDHR